MQTRRNFLKLASMLSGAAAVSGVVPESIQRAFAIEPEPGSTYVDAEHIVILMQENRSFDHALGTLGGVRGFNDPRAIRLANGNSVFVQTDKAGVSYAPWRMDIKDTRITWMGSIPHSRQSQVDAWREGLHDNWLDAKRSHNREYADVPMTMGHYTREDLPFYYAFADAFTVCDQHYCSVMSSTTPNRCYFWSGTIRDRQSPDSKVYIRNEEIGRGGMVWKTYPERLHEAGVSWKFYQNELTNSGLGGEAEAWLGNFGCNPLESFAAYSIEAYSGFANEQHLQIAHLTAEVGKLKQELVRTKDSRAADTLRAKLAHAQSRIASCEAALLKAGTPRYRELSETQRLLHNAAFVTNVGDPDYHALEPLPFHENGETLSMNVPKGDIFYQFRKDADEGKLPAVSWLTAPENFSDHPVSPWYGAWYVSEALDILTKNPEIWKKTIFILTYDENDGYFDHAPSFVAADPKRPWTGASSPGIDSGIDYTYEEDERAQGVAEGEARTGPIGLGFRVPMIIASPWSRGGWVNSQLFDHTSTLMFLEHFIQAKFGKRVREENISAWRRAICGNLTSCFRPYEAKGIDLDYLDRDKFVVSIQKARYKEVPSNYRKLSAEQIEDINNNRHSSFTAHQEPGIRPACPLPYELYVDGALNDDRDSFEVALRASNQVFGRNAAGAPFNIYLRNLKHKHGADPIRVATYAVKPGDTLRENFPLSLFADANYVIDVHGPNGFYRSFTGDTRSPNILIRTEYELNGAQLTGNVKVHLRNLGHKPLTVRIQDNSYQSGASDKSIDRGRQESVVLPLQESYGWYDFTVKAEGSSTAARFAGRVETGRQSFSDPLMGGSFK
jgi:phospholipase C